MSFGSALAITTVYALYPIIIECRNATIKNYPREKESFFFFPNRIHFFNHFPPMPFLQLLAILMLLFFSDFDTSNNVSMALAKHASNLK